MNVAHLDCRNPRVETAGIEHELAGVRHRDAARYDLPRARRTT